MSSLLFALQKHKWKGEWNEAVAKTYCYDHLKLSYPLGKLCGELSGVNMRSDVDTCLEDIKVQYLNVSLLLFSCYTL